MDETYRQYLDEGLGVEAAARAAIAEFDSAQQIAASFTDVARPGCGTRRLTVAGCVSIAVVDVVMITVSISLELTPRWPVAVAIGASMLRMRYGVRGVVRVYAR